MKREKYLGKLVGSPNLPQVHAELTGWETAAGKTAPGSASWACGPDRALDHLEDLGVQAHLMAWSDDPNLCVCVFALDGELFVTFPAWPATAAAQALHFVAVASKSSLT